MSVKRTVASTRSGSAGSRTPVRNSWISASISSASIHGAWSAPGSSTSLAPSMFRASHLPFSTLHTRSPILWRTSVDTLTAATTSRTSISKAMRMNVSASRGLADCIWRRPNQACSSSSSFLLGMKYPSARPFPQRSPIVGIDSSNSARVASPHGQSSVLSSFTSAPQSRSARVRSGWVAAKRIDIGPPSETPSSAARSDPAASMTALTSSIRSSSVPICTRSERPMPRLSKRISRAKDARRSQKRR